MKIEDEMAIRIMGRRARDAYQKAKKAPRSVDQPTRAPGTPSHPDRPSQTDGSNQ